MTRTLSRPRRPRARPGRRARQGGFLLIEVLVAVVILLVALLGTAGLVARSGQTEILDRVMPLFGSAAPAQASAVPESFDAMLPQPQGA